MKQFLLAKGSDGEVVLVEWDIRACKFRVTIDGKVATYLSEAAITEGIEDKDTYFWKGRNFGVFHSIHQELVSRYPTADHTIEYAKADEWLGAKAGRSCKVPLAFMSNWLKRSRGGNFSRGGVIY
jgi:hypothetical protein